MRPMRSSMYRHAVTLHGHAPAGSGGSPRYAGIDNAGGTPVTIRADVQGPKRERAIRAEQEVEVDVWRIYTDENPLLTTPTASESARSLMFKDGATCNLWSGLATVRAAMSGEAYGSDGVPVSWWFEVELVR